jgi:peptide/nickel transport system substrate-binding protein
VVTIEANPEYAWGPETLKNRQAPYIQSAKFRAVTEGSTRLATLESGESLVIDEVSEPDYARVKGDSRFKFVETPRRSHTFGFFMNVGLAPTNDPAVREAVNWAVDRASIVGKLFFGVHRTAAGPLSEGVWGRLDELDQRFSYDPKKASQLLEEADWKAGSDGIRAKDGQRLSLVLATFRSPWTEMAEAMQAQVREAGIDLQVQKMERGPYLDFVRGYKHHLCATASTSLDPDGILRVVYHSGNRPRNNFANLADPVLDALLDQGARQEINSPERRKTYEDAQRRVMELLPFVGIMSQVRVQAMAKKVNDFEMGPDGLSAAKLTSVWLDG